MIGSNCFIFLFLLLITLVVSGLYLFTSFFLPVSCFPQVLRVLYQSAIANLNLRELSNLNMNREYPSLSSLLLSFLFLSFHEAEADGYMFSAVF